MKLVIFDVDGTLVDSQHFIVEAQRRAFTALGLTIPSREASLSIVGLSLVEAFVELVGADGPCEDLAVAYRQAWQEMRLDPAFADPLYDGAASAVALLAARTDMMLGLATGKSRRGVTHLFAEQGWEPHFATVQTADDHPSKPHPSMILAALSETGVDAADAVMIGDTSYDMAMASAAGIRRIGVGWGYHSHELLRSGGAEYIVGSFDELTAMLASGAGWC